MAIYPKRNKKKVRSFYPGGRMPQGAADSPLVGIGLQYRATNAEAPNLQAAQYLDASLRESDAKHEEEYKKRLFDRKAYNDQMSKIIGTAGAKGRLSQDFNSALDAYEDKARENIDFVWTDEGRKMAKNIENVLDPGKIEKMKANYADLTTQYEQSLKNGTLNQNHVVNGMTSVIDKDGNIKKVHPTMLNSEENQGFRPLTNKEYYEAASNYGEYDFAGTNIAYSGATIKNTDQILSDWSERFEGLGYSGSDDGILKNKNNVQQIESVKRTIKASMSEQDRDAMIGLFISKSGGVYDREKFGKWMDGVLNDLAAGKRISDSDMRQLPSGSSGGGNKPSSETEISSLMPTLQRFPGQLFGERDMWFGDGWFGSDENIPITTTGESYRTATPMTTVLRGKVNVISDDGGYSTKGNQLAPWDGYSGKQVFGDVGYFMLPVSTGKELVIKDKETKSIQSDWKQGSVISTKFMGSRAGEVKEDVMETADGSVPYQYVSLGIKNGSERRLIVSEEGMKVISERNNDGKLTGTLFMSQITLKESLGYMGGDFGGIPDMTKVAYNNGLTSNGKSALVDIINQKYQEGAEIAKSSQLRSGDSRSEQAKQRYDELRAITTVLSNHVNGVINTSQNTGLDQGIIDQIEAMYTGDALQQRIYETYRKDIYSGQTIVPKNSNTTNTGGNIVIKGL